MPRRTPPVSPAMERQAALHEVRRSMAPLWRGWGLADVAYRLVCARQFEMFEAEPR